MKIRGMKAVLAALSLAALLSAALIIAQAAFLATSLTCLWEGQGIPSQLPAIAAFLGCYALRQILHLIRDTLLDSYSVDAAADMRDKLLEKIFLARTRMTLQKGTASLVTAAIEGVDEIESYLRIFPPKLAGLVFVAVPVLAAEFALDWVSGIILLATAPVIFYFMILLGKQASEHAARQYGTYQQLSNYFIDTLRGIPVLRAFGVSKREDARIYKVSEQLRKSSIKTISIATLSSALLDLTATLGVAAVAMMLAFRLLDGSMPLSVALMALMLAPEFYTPIRQFAGDFHASLDAKNALSDIGRLLDSESDFYDESTQVPAWKGGSSLVVDGLCFSYGENAVLDGISMRASGTQKIAIIGESGSGKSTLINILCGFLKPDGGLFTLEGASVSDLGIRSWASQLHYIPQKPYIFRGTLRQNICFYTPDAEDCQVMAAAHAVGLDALIEELPDGLDTLIGEGGRGLSGGQAQRIALARAFLDERPILVFDEPTAHLDIETELDLKKNMLELMEGKLVLFATHRLHWASSMDKVYELNDGRLEEVRP